MQPSVVFAPLPVTEVCAMFPRSIAIIFGAIALSLSMPALADSCLPSVQATAGTSGDFVVMTTMNNKQLVGYGTIGVGLVASQIAGKPPSWVGQQRSGGREIFSTNHVPGNPNQIFAANQSVSFNINITQEASPTVVIIFSPERRIEFTATCSANGVLHGVASGNDYLLTLTPVTIIP